MKKNYEYWGTQWGCFQVAMAAVAGEIFSRDDMANVRVHALCDVVEKIFTIAGLLGYQELVAPKNRDNLVETLNDRTCRGGFIVKRPKKEGEAEHVVSIIPQHCGCANDRVVYWQVDFEDPRGTFRQVSLETVLKHFDQASAWDEDNSEPMNLWFLDRYKAQSAC